MVYLLHTASFATLDEVKNYKSLKSFKYYTSGWVLSVEWKKYEEKNIVLIIGKVRHSYAANKAPVLPWVLVNFDGTILVAHCTCMAGLAETCSHVGAVLHWVETAVRIRNDTPCTSKDNKWLMPSPVKDIPYLELRDIDFTTPKCHSQALTSTHASTAGTSTSPGFAKTKGFPTPSDTEQQEFFRQIAQEKEKSPIVLSVTEPYSNHFVLSRDHLPKLLQGLFKPAYLGTDLAELLKLAESHLDDEATPEMVDHLAQLTHNQAKSREWFKYRAGRITASRFRRVLHTDCYRPSLSLLKSICYPEIHQFSTKAISWGCEHEKDALRTYKDKMLTSHEDVSISLCGFYISAKYPFLGASPDALIECKCCGQGVVEVKCPLCAQESSLAEAASGIQSFCLQECSEGKYELKHEHDYFYQCQLQMFVTNRTYCDFVVWTEKDLHTERLTLDDALIRSALPTARKFFSMCILPELLGKWYTRPTTANDEPQELEEDSGLWCHCKQKKGGDMVGCENRSCPAQWFHLECVGLTTLPHGKWYCRTCQPSRKRKISSMK